MDSREFRSLEGLRVLVVDDTFITRRLISHVLTQWHVSADMAPNGKMALEMLAKDAYDVVLMDIMMPEMDGYEATYAIRSRDDDYFRHLPIYAFSATPDLEKIMDCAMSGMISKSPLDVEELYDKISLHLK